MPNTQKPSLLKQALGAVVGASLALVLYQSYNVAAPAIVAFFGNNGEQQIFVASLFDGDVAGEEGFEEDYAGEELEEQPVHVSPEVTAEERIRLRILEQQAIRNSQATTNVAPTHSSTVTVPHTHVSGEERLRLKIQEQEIVSGRSPVSTTYTQPKQHEHETIPKTSVTKKERRDIRIQEHLEESGWTPPESTFTPRTEFEQETVIEREVSNQERIQQKIQEQHLIAQQQKKGNPVTGKAPDGYTSRVHHEVSKEERLRLKIQEAAQKSGRTAPTSTTQEQRKPIVYTNIEHTEVSKEERTALKIAESQAAAENRPFVIRSLQEQQEVLQEIDGSFPAPPVHHEDAEQKEEEEFHAAANVAPTPYHLPSSGLSVWLALLGAGSLGAAAHRKKIKKMIEKC